MDLYALSSFRRRSTPDSRSRRSRSAAQASEPDPPLVGSKEKTYYALNKK